MNVELSETLNKIKTYDYEWQLPHNRFLCERRLVVTGRGTLVLDAHNAISFMKMYVGQLFFLLFNAREPRLYRESCYLREERTAVVSLQSPKVVLLEIWKWSDELQIRVVTIL